MIARRDIAVLDTNIFVSAVLFKTATPRLALERAFTHGIVLTSSATRNELRDVLSRPKFDRYMSSPRRMADIEDLILDTRHVVVSHRFQVCRHPADDKFLDLAVAGGANVIVTGDRDLLALHPFQSIAILTPADYLALGKAAARIHLVTEDNMPREISWNDTLEIGIQLQEMFPEMDPYTVRFTDLHKYVTSLPGFVGDPLKSNEAMLEAIQTAWHEEYEDAKNG